MVTKKKAVKAVKAPEVEKVAEKPMTKEIAKISEMIQKVTNMAELEALTPLVQTTFGENIPESIQVLAEAKGNELEGAREVLPGPKVYSADPEEWKEASLAEVKEAEKKGLLMGYNSRTGFALIKKG